MLRPGGYASVTEADGTISRECDTFTCNHCNGIIRCRVGTSTLAPLCKVCMGRICKRCQAVMHMTLKCIPFEAKMEACERSAGRFVLGGIGGAGER